MLVSGSRAEGYLGAIGHMVARNFLLVSISTPDKRGCILVEHNLPKTAEAVLRYINGDVMVE